MSSVKPVPDGYHTVTPYLIIDGAARALEFYREAFGATELMLMPGPNGRVMHAEMQIGDSRVMLADEFPDMGYRGPQAYGGTSVTLLLYVENVDAVFQQAVAAGAKVLRPLENQFYGDRSGTVGDPFGHIWSLASHVEDVSREEMNARHAAMQQSKP